MMPCRATPTMPDAAAPAAQMRRLLFYAAYADRLR